MHFASGRKLLLYPEQETDFVLPQQYLAREQVVQTSDGNVVDPTSAQAEEEAAGVNEGTSTSAAWTQSRSDLQSENLPRGHLGEASTSEVSSRFPSPTPTIGNDAVVAGQADGEKKVDVIVVDWYGPDDPENPYNWCVADPLHTPTPMC